MGSNYFSNYFFSVTVTFNIIYVVFRCPAQWLDIIYAMISPLVQYPPHIIHNCCNIIDYSLYAVLGKLFFNQSYCPTHCPLNVKLDLRITYFGNLFFLIWLYSVFVQALGYLVPCFLVILATIIQFFYHPSYSFYLFSFPQSFFSVLFLGGGNSVGNKSTSCQVLWLWVKLPLAWYSSHLCSFCFVHHQ